MPCHKPEVAGSGELFLLFISLANCQPEYVCRTAAATEATAGDYYDNPKPDVRRQKRQRIYGTMVQACGEKKYTVRFDCRTVMECFSNTLCLEN